MLDEDVLLLFSGILQTNGRPQKRENNPIAVDTLKTTGRIFVRNVSYA